MKTSFEILTFDSGLFGFNTAKILFPVLAAKELTDVLKQLRQANVRFVYWFTDQEGAALALLHGGINMGEQVTLQTPLRVQAASDLVFSYEEEEANEALLSLSEQILVHSRFGRDRNLPTELATKLYHTWITNSVLRQPQVADELLVYEGNLGMITLKQKDEVGQIGLLAVAPTARHRGIGSQLLQAAHDYFSHRGVKQLLVVTQGGNLPALTLYQKQGFIVVKSETCVHFWLT